MLHALIYSPSSRLGLIITNDNNKRRMKIMSRINWKDELVREGGTPANFQIRHRGSLIEIIYISNFEVRLSQRHLQPSCEN